MTWDLIYISEINKSFDLNLREITDLRLGKLSEIRVVEP